MRCTTLFCLLAVMVSACGSSDGEPQFNAAWSHTFPAINVAAGSEEDYLCQSWTLNNDEPIYVSGVRQLNDGAWHHSNWFHVPEDKFGPDGTWDCRYPDGDAVPQEDQSRFDMVAAALSGGVIYAQSTQTLEETARFPSRTAVIIPPRSKVIGALHLVNFAASDIDTTITIQLETTEPETVDVQLQPLSFLIYSIQIPPEQESRWRMTCDMTGVYQNLERFSGSDQNLGIYYVLGHYHSWGNYFGLDWVHDDGTVQPIMSTKNRAGENLGGVVEPAVFADGAKSLRVTCGYNNDTPNTLVWGNDGDKEMCMFLAYLGSPIKVVAWGQESAAEVGMIDGMRTFDANCPNVTSIPVLNQ